MDFNKLSVLGVALLLQMVTVNAQASDISGVNPMQSGGSNIYNINPEKVNSSGLGFRQYEKFNLSNGDAANFIMTDISKFVNLVDSKVNINGLVNTVNADFSKSNGGLVFVSPEGFVVGSTGVLNVGSLSVYTPDSNSYKKLSSDLKNSIVNGSEPSLNLNPSSITYGSGVITIDGSLITNGDINLNSMAVNVGKDAHIVSGVNTTQTFMSKNTTGENLEYTKPEDIFYSLVNTSQMSPDKANINIETNGGNIELGGLVESRNGDINIRINDGNLVNAGSTDILLSSAGNLNITVTGTNAGNVGEIPVNTGSKDLTKSINVQAGGDVNIDAENYINLTSIDKDLIIDTVNAGDAVYLTVEKTPAFTGGNAPGIYSSKNHKAGTANVTSGGHISLEAAGNIGSQTNGGRFTLSSKSDSQQFNTSNWNNNKFNYTPNSQGIEVVSNQGDIYIQNNDTSSNIKNISAQKGSVNAQFAGNTYIENVTAGKNVDILTRGDVLYVENLDNTKSDFGTQNKVNFTALGLGEDYANSSDSTIILKNGRVQGGGENSDTNIEFTADNVYANGMHASLGKDRVETPLSDYTIGTHINAGEISITESDGTFAITSTDSSPVNVTFSSVSEEAVNAVEHNANLGRVYYTGEENSVTVGGETALYAGTTPDDGGFGDTDDDSDASGDTGGIDMGDTDDDEDLEPPITADSDDDSDTGSNEGGEPDINTPGDDDENVDNPNIGDSDSDDDIDVPPVGGDTDDDDDTDIPGGGSGSGGEPDINNPGDDDENVDNPNIGDSDSDDDIDVPPVGGDTDDDEDSDIPGGDTDTDNDDDNPPIGDTDDDEGDIPGTKPINPGNIDPESPIPAPYTINTEPPKPLSVIPEIGANNITPDEDIENESPINTNRLFLDNDTDTDMDVDTYNTTQTEPTKKKKKFYFRYRFR